MDGKRTALPSLFLFCLFVTLGLEGLGHTWAGLKGCHVISGFFIRGKTLISSRLVFRAKKVAEHFLSHQKDTEEGGEKQ